MVTTQSGKTPNISKRWAGAEGSCTALEIQDRSACEDAAVRLQDLCTKEKKKLLIIYLSLFSLSSLEQ